MRFVLDSSVVMRWLLRDGEALTAAHLTQQISQMGLGFIGTDGQKLRHERLL